MVPLHITDVNKANKCAGHTYISLIALNIIMKEIDFLSKLCLKLPACAKRVSR